MQVRKRSDNGNNGVRKKEEKDEAWKNEPVAKF